MPWQRSIDSVDMIDTVVAESSSTEAIRKSAYTNSKGRPTPKRREAERKRGPVAPPPLNRAEARARRKALRKKMSKKDRAQARAKQRELRNEMRERRLAGDEEYLLPKDKGPVRRYARNIVDSRRNFAEFFTPVALVFLVLIYGLPKFSGLISIILMIFLLLVVADLFYLGWIVNRKVSERFPESTDGGLRMGWYAAARGIQMRKLRVPKHQVTSSEAK